MVKRVTRQARSRFFAINAAMATLDQLAESLLALKPGAQNKLDREHRKTLLAELKRRGWQGVRRY